MVEKLEILCISIAIVGIIVCIGAIESVGTYFDDIKTARFLFGIGVFVGLMVMYLSNVFAYKIGRKCVDIK